jgi:ankyrin repeat protein
MELQKLDMVRYVLNFWPDWTISGRNALYMAVADPIRIDGATLQKVQFLLTVAPGMVAAADDHQGRLPLHAAVENE